MSRFTTPDIDSVLEPALSGIGDVNAGGIGFFERGYDYFRETTAPALARMAQRWSIPDDPDWSPSLEEFEAASDGIDTDLIGMFGKAGSQQELYLIAAHLQQLQGGRDRIAQRGVAGVVGQMGAYMIDPVFLAAGFGAARVATAPAIVEKMTRTGRFAYTGAIYGSVDAGIEAYNVSQYPDRGATDILIAALASGTLGGALETGAINRTMASKVRAKKDIEFTIAVQNGHFQTIQNDPTARSYFGQQLKDFLVDQEGRATPGDIRPDPVVVRAGKSRIQRLGGFFADAWRGEGDDLGDLGDDVVRGLDERFAQQTLEAPIDDADEILGQPVETNTGIEDWDDFDTRLGEQDQLDPEDLVDSRSLEGPPTEDGVPPIYRLNDDTGDLEIEDIPLMESVEEPRFTGPPAPKNLDRSARRAERKAEQQAKRERKARLQRLDKGQPVRVEGNEVLVDRTDVGWERLEGHLVTYGYSPLEKSVIRVALKDLDADTLGEFRFGINPKQGAEGRARVRVDDEGRRVGDVEVDVRPDAPTMGRALTFLHEMGHALGYTVLDADDWAEVDRVFQSRTQKEWAKWFSRGQQNRATARAQGQALARNQSEFLAQAFAEWVVSGRLANPSIQPLLRRLAERLREVFSFLRGRGVREIQDLEAIFEKMLKGSPNDGIVRDTFAGPPQNGVVSRATGGDSVPVRSGAEDRGPPVPPMNRRAGDFFVHSSEGEGFATAIRLSPDAAISRKSVPELVRGIGSAIFGTQARGGVRNREILGENALTAAHRVRTNLVANFNRRVNKAYHEWARANKITLRDRARIKDNPRDRFFREAFRTSNEGQYSMDPHIREAQEAMASLTKETHAFAVRHGLPGFERFEADEFYVPWLFSRRKLVDFEARNGGRDSSVSLIAQAMKNASDSLSDSESLRIGRVIRDKIVNEDQADSHLWLSGSQRKDLYRFLFGILKKEREDGLITEDEIRAMARVFRPSGGKTRFSPRARYRTPMDRRSYFDLPNGAQATLADLVEDDLAYVAKDYLRSVIGDSVMQPIYRHAEQRMGLRTGSILNENDLRAAMVADLEAEGIDTATSGARKSLDLIDIMIGRVKGRPLDEQFMRDHPNFRAFLELMQSVNFARLSGRFGFASLPEMFRAAAIVNFDTAMAGVPEMFRVIRDVRNGAPPPRHFAQSMDRLYAAAGLGWDSHQIMRHMGASGDFDVQVPGASSSRLEDLNYAARRVSRPASALSGLPFITDVSQRWAQSLIIDDIVRKAIGNRNVTDAYLDKIGMNRLMWERVKAGINNSNKKAASVSGGNYRDIDVANWNDGTNGDQMESLSALAVGSYRFATRQVLQPEASDIPLFVQGTIGKTLFQFRSFAIASHDKLLIQTGRDVLAGDISGSGQAALLTAIAAAGVYAAQTALESSGKPNREEYLKERLSAQRLAVVSFYRSGFLGLAPDFIESGVRLGTGYSLFTGARQTGLTLDPFNYNPTHDLLFYDTAGALQGIKNTLMGDLSAEDVQAWYELLPGHRLPFIMEGLESVSNTLPSRSER